MERDDLERWNAAAADALLRAVEELANTRACAEFIPESAQLPNVRFERRDENYTRQLVGRLRVNGRDYFIRVTPPHPPWATSVIKIEAESEGFLDLPSPEPLEYLSNRAGHPWAHP